MITKKDSIYGLLSIALTIMSSISYNSEVIKFNYFMNSGNWEWFAFFIFFILIFKVLDKIYDKRLFIFSSITGIILSICNSIGYAFTYYVLYDINITTKLFIYLFIKFVLNTFVLTVITIFIYYFIDHINYTKEKNCKLNYLFKYTIKHYFIIAFIIFLAYIPWFLNYFPGICSSDSTNQMLQMVDNNTTLSNHHPIFHTLIIGLCLKIGNVIFGSNQAGVAIYSILQMICCSLAFSAVVFYCEKKKVPLIIRKILLLFFMFCPIIASYSITMWKDIPFALSITITTMLLIDACTNSKEFFLKRKNIFLLLLFFLLDILFRKNGLYCVLFVGIIYLFVLEKKYKKKFSVALIIPIILYFVISGPVFSFFNIKEGETKEALSIPMQQFARISKYHSKELKIDEKKELDSFFLDNSYTEKYDPTFADPVKRVFNEKYMKKNKGKLLSLYFKYLLKYPIDTIKSFISGSYGYYYPNLVGWEVFNTIYSDNYTKILNIKQTPIHKFWIINKLEVFLNSHNIPLLSMFTSCGFYFWLLIVSFIYLLYKKRYKIIPSIFILFGVWGTALMSPVFCERRYVYSLFIVVPLLFAICFIKKSSFKEGNY